MDFGLSVICCVWSSLAAHHLLGVEGLGEGSERGVVHTTVKAQQDVDGGLLQNKTRRKTKDAGKNK